MSKKEEAKKLFEEGYNCSQAVLAAFCDELNISREDALKMASSFGGGMGRMREVCGAVSGMFMVAGFKEGYSDPSDIEAKKKHYELIQKMAAEFSKENGSIICRELLGLKEGEKSVPKPSERTEEYYQKRPCGELVAIAAEIAENILKK
jgi:C_GCAxxG_C_C family probable redox protein